MTEILLVEDDKSLASGIALAIQTEDKKVLVCNTFQSAKEVLEKHNFQLIILDIGLPDGSGLELLKEYRIKLQVPIIMLTANDLETDVVAGLELGADDYITKPFSLAILRARVHAALRKYQGDSSDIYHREPFHFDFDQMLFQVGNIPVELSKTEQRLLKLLVKNREKTLPRALLVDRIWTDGSEYVDENALSVTVKRLRDKLNDHGNKHQYIKTIYGIGYSWVE